MTATRRLLAALLLVTGHAAAPHAARAAEQPLPPIRFQLVATVEERPLLVTHGGQPGRAFVIEQPGRVDLLKDGKLVDKPYLDLTDAIYAQGECGLLGLAFHPRFAENGLFY